MYNWLSVMVTHDVLSRYKLFKIYGSFKWKKNVEVESTDSDTFLKEFIKMTFNLATWSKYTFKGTVYYWMNEKNCSKIFQALCNFWANFISWLVFFFKFVYGFNHVNYLLSREALWASNPNVLYKNSQTYKLIFMISSVPTKPILLIKK